MDKCVKMMTSNTISIRVSMRIKKYGGKKMIILPEGCKIKNRLKKHQSWMKR